MGVNTRSVRYGASVLTLANILSQLLGFVYRMFLSRAIGAEGMGLFQLIFPFYSLSLSIAASGICVAVSRLSAEYMALGNYKALRLLIRRATLVFFAIFAGLSGVSALFAGKVATGFLGDERTRLAIYALIPVVFLTGVENIHKNFFYGTKNVNPPAFSDFVEQVIRMMAVLGLLWLFFPQRDEVMLVIIVFGMLACEIFSAVFLRAMYVRQRKRMPKLGADDPEMSKKISKIAVPVSLSNLLNNLLSSLIVIIIPRRLVVSGLTQSQSLSEYGILFGMSMPLLALSSSLVVGLGLVMIPKLAENLALGNYADLRSKISRAITVTSFVVLPMLAVSAVLGESLGRQLFGQEIDGKYLIPLAVGMAFAIYMSITGSILNGLGKQNSAAFNFILGNAVELALVYSLVAKPEIRMNGYVAAFVISAAITAGLNLQARGCGLQAENPVAALVYKSRACCGDVGACGTINIPARQRFYSGRVGARYSNPRCSGALPACLRFSRHQNICGIEKTTSRLKHPLLSSQICKIIWKNKVYCVKMSFRQISLDMEFTPCPIIQRNGSLDVILGASEGLCS